VRGRFLILLSALVLFSGCSSLSVNPLARPPEELLAQAEEAFRNEKYPKAREFLEALKGQDAERKYYARAQILLADSYFAEGLYPEAAVEYKAFLDLHTYHERAPYAQYGLALSYLEQVDSVDRGFENVTAARRELRTLLERYPRNPYREAALAKLARCRNLLAEYENYVAVFYMKKGAWRAAAARYEGLLRDYPDSTVEIPAMLSLGRAYLELGEKEKAVGILSKLVEKYPSSRQAIEARKLLGGS